MKAGGSLAWVVDLAGATVSGAIGRVVYYIGYGTMNRECDINASPYRDASISATVR